MIKNAEIYCAAVWKISLPGIAAETDHETTIPIATHFRIRNDKYNSRRTQIREKDHESRDKNI